MRIEGEVCYIETIDELKLNGLERSIWIMPDTNPYNHIFNGFKVMAQGNETTDRHGHTLLLKYDSEGHLLRSKSIRHFFLNNINVSHVFLNLNRLRKFDDIEPYKSQRYNSDSVAILYGHHIGSDKEFLLPQEIIEHCKQLTS